VTAIYDRITYGLAWAPGPYIYTTDWEKDTDNTYSIWKTNKLTGQNFCLT